MSIALFQGDNLRVIAGGPQVDNKTGEYHAFSATPTMFSIENGSIAADHIIENPDSLEVTWIMSNLDGDGSSYGNRAATLLDSLHRLIKERQLYEVVTRHKIYPSMALVGVTADHLGPFSGALRGRLIFSEVPRVTLERTAVPASAVAGDVSKTASTRTDGGRVEGKDPTDADRQRAGSRGSVASQIFRNAV